MRHVTPLLESRMPLSTFLERYREGLIEAVAKAYPPRVQHLDPLPPLNRRPLGRQHDAITAVAVSLKQHRGTHLVAEMGCGKTFVSLAATHAACMQRILVVCPPHLVEKWAREVHHTVPNARARILTSIRDINALLHDPTPGPLVAILSREKAKLGHRWTPAYTRKHHHDRDADGRPRTVRLPACPTCGRVLETDDGLFTHQDLAKKKHGCSCGAPLWQADCTGPRRYPLAHYIAKKLRGYFEVLILDEMHEFKSKNSAQGIAAGALAEAIPKTIGLTGTLFGGYASNLFYLLYRFSPRVRTHFAFDEETRFVQRYGVLERVTRERHHEDGRVSRRKGRTTTTKERPGMSPEILPQVLFNTVFMRLSDIAEALPSYHETVEVLAMQPEQYRVHQAFKRELASALKQQLASGSKRLLGAYVQSLLHHPDTPWRDELVTTTDTNGLERVVAQAEALSAELAYPKEARLVEIARAEKAHGRNLLVLVQGTERRDITPRLSELLTRAGLTSAILKSHTVPAAKRERWVQEQVKRGIDVLMCHPRCVQTGLDLLEFPTLIFYQVEYSVFTLRQASRRSWRLGQGAPVKVIHLAYDATLQTQALSLLAKKTQASLALEGELVEGGLLSMAEDDMMVALAKTLVEGDGQPSITKLNSAFGEDDDPIGEPPAVSEPPTLADLNVSPAHPHEVKRVAFLETPLTLGKGRNKHVIAEGAGVLFPDLMGLADAVKDNC